jgi:UDP-N-acetylmuramate dehydrogenase
MKFIKLLHATFYLCKMPVKNNISLKPYNTFGIDLNTKYFFEVKSVSDFKEAVAFSKTNHAPVQIIGSGSNVLFLNNFNGLIVKNGLLGKEIINETDSYLLLKVKSGEDWPLLVDYCVQQGWGGIENLSLIPGTAGAAPVQNIGAYGAEVKDVIEEVEVYDLQSGSIVTFSNNNCAFSYRNSIFKTSAKKRYFVLSVTLRLIKNSSAKLNYAPLQKYFAKRDQRSITVKEVSDAVKQIRRSKLPDPDELGNAGSFFKNPVVSEKKFKKLKNSNPDIPSYPIDNSQFKLAAGWLIEQCGWKGNRIGDAGVHAQQALVLVNYGNATGNDILNLAKQINKSVKDRFGLNLEFEVNVIE